MGKIAILQMYIFIMIKNNINYNGNDKCKYFKPIQHTLGIYHKLKQWYHNFYLQHKYTKEVIDG